MTPLQRQGVAWLKSVWSHVSFNAQLLLTGRLRWDVESERAEGQHEQHAPGEVMVFTCNIIAEPQAPRQQRERGHEVMCIKDSEADDDVQHAQNVQNDATYAGVLVQSIISKDRHTALQCTCASLGQIQESSADLAAPIAAHGSTLDRR